MHVVKCHSARAEAIPKVAPVAAQNTIKLCPHEDTNLRAAIFLTCSLYRPVARKAPVGGGALSLYMDALNRYSLPYWG